MAKFDIQELCIYKRTQNVMSTHMYAGLKDVKETKYKSLFLL